MAEAYNVRSDGQKYYVYRLDGNVMVGQFDNAAEAQRSAAIQNQRYNEQFGKKKEVSSGSKAEVPDPPPGQGVNY